MELKYANTYVPRLRAYLLIVPYGIEITYENVIYNYF